MPDGERMRTRQFIGPGARIWRHRAARRARASPATAVEPQIVLGVIMTQLLVPGLGDRLGVRQTAQARRKSVCRHGGADHVRRRDPDGGGDHHGRMGAAAPTPRSLPAVLYLVVVGTFVGYVSYVYALKHLPVSIVSLYAYVNPVIAVILGSLILKERFTPRMAVAIAIIFAAMLIVRTADTSRS